MSADLANNDADGILLLIYERILTPTQNGGNLTVPPRSRRDAGRGIALLLRAVREERKTKLAHVFLSEWAVVVRPRPRRLQAGVQGRDSGDPE